VRFSLLGASLSGMYSLVFLSALIHTREITRLVIDHRRALDQPGAHSLGPQGLVVVNTPVNPILDRR
jgi:hypothetical protein